MSTQPSNSPMSAPEDGKTERHAMTPPHSETTAGEWRAIETAPKDGTDILLRVPVAGGFSVAVGRCYDDGPWRTAIGSRALVTHWQPIPSPDLGAPEPLEKSHAQKQDSVGASDRIRPEPGAPSQPPTTGRIEEIREEHEESRRTFLKLGIGPEHMQNWSKVRDLLAEIDRLNALDDHLQSQMGSELGKVAWAESVIADLRQRVAGLEGELAEKERRRFGADAERRQLRVWNQRLEAQLEAARAEVVAARQILDFVRDPEYATRIDEFMDRTDKDYAALPPVEGKDQP